MADGGPFPPEEERALGLGVYMTTTAPLGGKLKRLPEDFMVNEIALPPPVVEGGPFTIAKIKVYNWETNRLIRAFSKRLGISRRRIGFAGTKDKRAVTTQMFSFQAPMELVRNIGLKDVFVLDTYASNRGLEIGDLQGNSFLIRIRDIERDDPSIRDNVSSTIGQITEVGGFPNYFGVQRFGSIRPITHLIGKHMLARDFKRAVMEYIGNPGRFENTVGYESRKRLETDLDFKKALDYYPQDYLFERSMISYLARHDEDWVGAIDQLPDNLKMMFVHAYQSYLFNRILTERVHAGLPLSEPVAGDIILPLNKNLVPDHRTYIEVNEENLSEMGELVRKKKAFVSGLIAGYEPVIAKGEMGEIEARVLSEDKVSMDSFLLPDINNVSSRGIRREILAIPFDLKWRVEKVSSVPPKEGLEDAVEIRFSLFRGTYATSLLREIMKAEILDY